MTDVHPEWGRRQAARRQRWARGTKQRLAFLSGVAMACLLVVVSGCASDVSQTSSPITAVVKTPSATPLPTISLASPILGGSWGAFDKLFGDSNCCYENGWDYQGPFGATWTGVLGGDGLTVMGNANARVAEVETYPQNGGSWTVSQTQAMQNQFMPPDAKLKSTKPIYLGNIVSGTEKTYSSVLLARTLPAADFKDANGKPATAGVFYVYWSWYANPTNPNVYDHCVLGTDKSSVLSTY